MRSQAAGNYENFYNTSDESLGASEGEKPHPFFSVFSKSADSKSVATTHLWRWRWLRLTNLPQLLNILKIKVLCCTFIASSLGGNVFSCCLAWWGEKFLNDLHYCVYLHPLRSHFRADTASESLYAGSQRKSFQSVWFTLSLSNQSLIKSTIRVWGLKLG